MRRNRSLAWLVAAVRSQEPGRGAGLLRAVLMNAASTCGDGAGAGLLAGLLQGDEMLDGLGRGSWQREAGHECWQALWC